MKLYNLFESVIFEELGKARKLLVEGVSDDAVIAAIDGKYNVNIMYRDEGQTQASKRYIQVYVFGELISGNYGIRAYQIDGGSNTSKHNWKIFRLDRIEGWFPTKMKWHKPVSDSDATIGKYNANGDKKGNFVPGQSVPTFKRVIKQVKFNNPTPQEQPQNINKPINTEI